MEEIQAYVDRMKSLQQSILTFIEHEKDDEENYENLIKLLNDLKISENHHRLKSFIYLLKSISTNHNRTPNFINKIEKLIKMYKDEIKQTYSNIELFQLFMKQKAILLFLLKEEILAIDQPVASLMNKYKYDSFHYPLFYFPEIKPFEHKRRLHDLQKEVPENLEEIRKIGENDSELCKIIRKDSVEEFIAYINLTKTKLDEKIDPSINETNHFLIKNKPELIEYAAFYGSIEIIKYLQSQNIELKPSLWLYSIHSNKIEMIQFLEENKVEPEDKTYEKCLKESVKCHHNDIANYIKEKYVKEEEVNYFKGKRFNVNVLIVYAFHYYNYNYFPKGLHNHFCMSYLCQYDYYELIELLLKMKKINVNVDVVLLYFFFRINDKICFIEFNIKYF